MYKTISFVFFILSALLLSGCGSKATGPQFSGFQKNTDKAIIYVLPRVGSIGATDATFIEKDGQEVRLPDNGYLKYVVEEGKTTITNTIGINAVYTLDAKRGKSYCLEAKITHGFWAAYSHLYRISLSSCQERIKNLRLAN